MEREIRYDVAGIGNALVDSLVVVDDQDLSRFEFERGIMHVVDHEVWQKVYHRFERPEMEVHSGGSCANTIAALGLLGARVLFRGQVGNDGLGRRYRESLIAACGDHALAVAAGQHTGKCLSLVSREDQERTMLTDLGTAPRLDSLGEFADRIRQARIFHLTGYALLEGPIQETAKQALELASREGVQVSLDVADPFVVSNLHDDLWSTIEDHADIVFMNEEEAGALCQGLPPEQAANRVARVAGTVVVKLGAKGSLVERNGHTVREGIHAVDAVDTTGAGDSYAAGFLFGLVNDWPLTRCARLAARVAGLTVSQLGAVFRDREALAAQIASSEEHP